MGSADHRKFLLLSRDCISACMIIVEIKSPAGGKPIQREDSADEIPVEVINEILDEIFGN